VNKFLLAALPLVVLYYWKIEPMIHRWWVKRHPPTLPRYEKF